MTVVVHSSSLRPALCSRHWRLLGLYPCYLEIVETYLPYLCVSSLNCRVDASHISQLGCVIVCVFDQARRLLDVFDWMTLCLRPSHELRPPQHLGVSPAPFACYRHLLLPHALFFPLSSALAASQLPSLGNWISIDGAVAHLHEACLPFQLSYWPVLIPIDRLWSFWKPSCCISNVII